MLDYQNGNIIKIVIWIKFNEIILLLLSSFMQQWNQNKNKIENKIYRIINEVINY